MEPILCNVVQFCVIFLEGLPTFGLIKYYSDKLHRHQINNCVGFLHSKYSFDRRHSGAIVAIFQVYVYHIFYRNLGSQNDKIVMINVQIDQLDATTSSYYDILPVIKVSSNRKSRRKLGNFFLKSGTNFM